TRLAVGPCRSFRFLDAWDPFVDQHHGEDQEQDGDDDRVVLAQRGLPAVQDRLSLLAHRERDYERSGHAERGDENVHRDGPHLLPSRQARRGDSHRRCYADDDVLWVERADAYTNEQGLAGSEPSDAIHPLRHRRLLGSLAGRGTGAALRPAGVRPAPAAGSRLLSMTLNQRTG